MNADASTQATEGLTEWFDEYKNEQSPALCTVEMTIRTLSTNTSKTQTRGNFLEECCSSFQ